MDAVTIGAILAVIGSIVVVGFVAIKVVGLMNSTKSED